MDSDISRYSKGLIAIPSTLATSEAWGSVGILFLIALMVLYIGNRMLSRPLRGLFWSFVVVFALSLLAQYVAGWGVGLK